MLQDILNKPLKATNYDGLLKSNLPKQKLPENAQKMFNVGAKALKEGDLVTATDRFSKVLKIKPDHLPTIEAMGMACYELGNENVAENFFKALIEMAPAYLQGYIKLGILYSLQEKLDDAEAVLKKGLIIEPEDEELLKGLAYIYSGAGLKDKAQDVYRKLIFLEPDNPGPLYAFSTNFYKYSDLDNDPIFQILKKYEKKLHRYDTRQKQEILASLGKAYQDVEDYDKAFAYYKKAAAVKRKDLDFEPEKLLRGLDMLKTYFDDDFFNALEENNVIRHPSSKPVFICGFPRSGTTLLEQILHSHPDIYGIGESGFLFSLFERHPVFMDYKGKTFPIAFREDSLRNKPLDFLTAGQKYVTYLEGYTKNVKYYVNKAISNLAYAGPVKAIFPNAKFIHLKRNPLDSCLSCFTQHFNEDVQPYTYDLKELGQFYQVYDQLMEYWKGLFLDSVYTLTYEDLVNNTEKKTKEVLDFLDLPWDERCLDFYKTEKFVKTASVSQVRKPVYKTAQNNWKRYAEHLKPLIESLGDYAPDDSLYLIEEKQSEKRANNSK